MQKRYALITNGVFMSESVAEKVVAAAAVMPEATPGKILLKALKSAGLNVGEEAAKGVVEAVFDALPAFFLATENKVDDVAVVLIPVLKPYVMKALDKIDGEVG